MKRNDDTAEIAGAGDAGGPPAPGDAVGRVNLREEPEMDPQLAYDAMPDAGASAALTAPGDPLREKILYGVLTVVLMVVAMVMILQGVFEQKMPV